MKTVIDDGEKKTIQEIWDHHGKYQWSYFAEEAKQLINFFLYKQLSGKNLDLGGGWYLPYPNSTVVDVSPVCLEYNLAKEKLVFDLDDITQGKKLPFREHSFDSATMISVWQYLQNPKRVVKELERVLRPGAEVYIINGQSSGLEECRTRSSKSEDAKNYLSRMGYDCIIENIPFIDGETETFRSVCFAMPYTNLFGERLSKIDNKEKRIEANKEICEHPRIFLEEFAEWEIKKCSAALSRLSRYPITEYSRQFRNNVEKMSDEYRRLTGKIPLVFAEYDLKAELDMLLPKQDSLLGTTVILESGPSNRDENENEADIHDIGKKYGVGFSNTIGYFGTDSIEEVIEGCKGSRKCSQEYIYDCDREREESKLSTYVRFICSLPLNSFAEELQKKIYLALKPNVGDLDERIKKQNAWTLHFAVYESKQRRKIDELIAVKKKICGNGVKTIGEGRLDYLNYLKYFPEIILGRRTYASEE